MKSDSSNGAINSKKEFSLRFAVISTFLSLLPTAYVWFQSNSVVLFTDLLRCLVEFLAILLSWLIVRRILKGDQSHYDYGFGKLEQMGTLAVAAALFASFVTILVVAVYRVLHPTQVENIFYGLILAFLSVAGNLSFWLYNLRLARLDPSPLLSSQRDLFRAKTFASVVVLISLSMSQFSSNPAITYYADPVGSVVLAGFILYSAIRLLSSSMYDLLDCSIDEALKIQVLKVLVRNEDQYLGLGNILTRRAGNKAIVEITLEFPGNLLFSEVDATAKLISSEIEKAIANCQVTVVPKLAGE